MLKEKIVYKDTLPINVLTAEIDEYPIHFHEDMEVVYILKGMITMRNGCYTQVLKEGDIYIFNDREMHSFEKIDGEENMVMMLQIDLTYFGIYYDSLKNSFYVTDQNSDDDEALDGLRTIMARVMMELLQKGYGYEENIIESIHNLIGAMEADFKYFLLEDGRFVNEVTKRGNKVLAGRLNRIVDYMYDNYYRKLTLGEIADREHLSIYYLSHVIKEATGLSFQDLLSFIRVEESEKLLLGTNKKISTIAEETGFSAVRYYVKHFETWFGMHPSEYRKKYTGKVRGGESNGVLRRCTPTEIEEAIRTQEKKVYTDYMKKQKPAPVIVDLDMNDTVAKWEKSPKSAMEKIFERKINEPMSGLYRIMASLGEDVLAKEKGYIVTVDRARGGISLLIFNMEDQLGSKLMKLKDKKEIYEALAAYDVEMEALFRINNLSGEFKAYSYRFKPESYLAAYRHLIEKDDKGDMRKAILENWNSLPEVESRLLNATETLSIRTTLKGFCGELILIEPVG